MWGPKMPDEGIRKKGKILKGMSKEYKFIKKSLMKILRLEMTI